MMLRTSSNKLNPAFGMFKITLKRNIGIIILTVIGTLMLCPGYLMLILVRSYGSDLGKVVIDFNVMFIILGAISSIVSAVAAVAYNIINFSYLYSKKSGDVFHSAPLTRTELLLSRGMASIVSTLIPVMVGYIAISCVAVAVPMVEANFGILAVCFFYNILIMLVAWAISLLFIVCAGTAFDFVISFGIVNGGMLLLPVIISAIAEETLFGYDSSSIYVIMKWMSPVYFCGFSLSVFINRVDNFINGGNTADFKLFTSNEYIMLAISLVLIVGITALTIFLYSRRRSEKAGNAYAFKFLYIIASLILSFEVAYGLGMLFSQFSLGIVFWVFAVISALLSAVIFGAISERGFKQVKKSLIIGAISAVALILVNLSLQLDILGFETRVPKVKNIESVTVTVAGYTVELSDDDIKYAAALHRKIIEDYDDAIHYLSSGEGEGIVSEAHFTYTLKNGTKVNREYWTLPVDIFGKEMLEICRRVDVDSTIKQVKKSSVIGNIMIEMQFEDEYRSYNITKDEFINLLEAYKKDIQKISADIFSNNETYYVWWDTKYDYHNYEFCAGENYTDFKEAVNALAEKYEKLYAEQTGGKD